ncbi:hypothetical protein DXG03_002596 [Asterophora parasitica]|uniref:PNPLA domain-containing protein n=1 Tax=Asterophora parasitica TaxID=117018 RepID=A0A9P7K9Q9_9AGAR|nr:hypothetical protein DXG03_002596 [Asterophora parasitica]
MPAKNMSSPRIFRSHDVPENQTANCKIWEAARATSAAPTFFKRVSIDHDGLPEEFVDAGLGCNNPVNEVYNEAQLVFGRDREISCIVSIGTGHPKVIGFSAPDKFERLLPVALIGVLQSIATDCEKVAEDFERKYNSDPSKSKVFFRFNVQQGLQDVSLAEWNKLADVKTHTTKYVQETAVGVNINRVRDIVKSHSRLTVHRDVLVNETGDLR